ncbi:zinc finger CCCH domain-containing protein 18 isoform X1 [Cryptomeria japonica]|uniref:zinc finger CCCH domain-containing protein 18 isoform X1 n=1 Tax=Cryptomeria japonica TaxID=3369 RepID=UPI0027DAA088|nr:zinc finger CCCH domain-containing protein 18 isoform X1 [Cryptomeria japonica]XP_059067375.1 zinc finger CCCH domain-containing protein 18 isoform X1 [Cryptomeria japonica]XP_059067376.1 zinc finger CCCH domain-containing protein 18 isoform X1 [Cryptomeria japonica]
MDIYEATRIVFSKIQSVDPENVSKIIGYLLLQDNGDREMIRLAFGPDSLIHSVISKAKKELGMQVSSSSSSQLLSPYAMESPVQFAPFSHIPSRPFSAVSPQTVYWDSQAHQETPLSSHFAVPIEQNALNFINRNPLQAQFFGSDKLQQHSMVLTEQPSSIRDYTNNFQPQDQQLPLFENDSYNYPEMQLASGELGMDFLSKRVSLPISDVKPCLYFARGYCKHGSNCRFSHGFENHLTVSMGSSPSESLNEEPISAGTLERLEIELLDLLRGKRAPISIASLPQLYYERFGKTLQAEGYLTESQRHGKAGYSLTKLLARLKTIRLIDRPHGQHAVVLAEDAPRFTEYRGERNEIAGLIAGSRQIYLTFPAESTFTEEDVSNYFRTYGPVHDVRIPYQQKRMFGFVTFVFPETVKTILAKGNPHYVCGARVLVKPYREKGKHGDRRYTTEKPDHTKYMPAAYNLDDFELQLGPRIIGTSDMIRTQFLLEEQEQILEIERRRLAELHLMNQASKLASNNNNNSSNLIVNQHHHNHHQNDLESNAATTPAEDLIGLPSAEQFSYLLEVLNSESINGDKPKQNGNDQESSHGHNLPESPFATPRGSYAANDISTVT